MLKIAICTDSFLPVKDGVGRVAEAYARLLAKRGHEVYVVTPQTNDGYRGGLPFETLDFTTLSSLGLPQSKVGAATLDMHYLARADNIPFDVVHAHSPGAAGMEGVRLAEKLRVPLIGTFHSKYIREYLSEDEGDEKQTALSKYFALDYFSRCDEIWTANDEMRDLLADHGFGGSIEVFDNGADNFPVGESEINAARAAFHLTDTPVLLFVGSLEKQKNLPRILEAASLLKARGVSFQLLFVGQGPAEKTARNLAHDMQLGGTARFLGYVGSDALLNGLYALSELCLFPTSSVTAGLVLREAAVQGTPSLVIAGSVGAQVKNGVNGLVCGDTPESMADAIEGYLSSPERRKSMRTNVVALAPTPWETTISRVETRYYELTRMDRAQLKRKRGFFRKELARVDLTLEKRFADLAWRFLRQDNQHLYAYPYLPQKPAAFPNADEKPLPRATPEEEGVSSLAINAFLDHLNADAGACAQEVMILRHGKVIAEASWAPYDAGLPHELYSLSKSVTATAIGMLVDEGRLGLDELLCDIFFDKAPARADHPSRKLTVRHLLNMSTGALFNEIGTALGADWEREFLRAGNAFPAGTAFSYNSLNTYMLAAIVRRKTGLTLTEYLTPRLFEPLGVVSHHWETCPNGTEKGGWGLSLTTESVAKIGQLYLNKGRWNVNGEMRQLLSEQWIADATRAQIETPNGEITYGYGHQIWMTARKGAFLFNGAFGQYMLALPDADALVVLFSGTARLFAKGDVLRLAEEAMSGASDTPLPQNKAALSALTGTIRSLSARCKAPYYDAKRMSVPPDPFFDWLDGRVYSFGENVAGLFPVVLQNVHNNYSTGVRQVVFHTKSGAVPMVEFVEGAYTHLVPLPRAGFATAAFTQREDTYEARVSMQTEQLASGERAIHLNVHFIETPFTRVMHMTFVEDSLTIVFDESPSVQDASTMLLELTGVTRTQMLRSLMPLLKREQLQHTLRTFTTTTIKGRL